MNLLWCIVKGLGAVFTVLGLVAIILTPPVLLALWVDRKWGNEKASLLVAVLVLVFMLGVIIGIVECYWPNVVR